MLTLQANAKSLIFLLVAMLGMSGQVVAQDLQNWYVGGTVGQSDNLVDHDGITKGVFNGGVTTGGGLAVTSITDNNYATAYKLFAGYQVCSNFAIEAGYFDLGKLGFVANTNPSGTLTGEMKAHGVFADGLVSHKVDENTALFARAGITFNQAESDFSSAGAVQLLRTSYSDNSTDYHIGLGAARKIWQALSVRAEIERFRLDDGTKHQENVNMISLGLVYRF